MLSAETIANNTDLLTDILIRVPTKPLLKFKCVSKQWLSLISNPTFCLSHTRHHHTPNPIPTALLLNNGFTPTPEFQIVPLKENSACNVPFLDYLNIPGVMILQSCNGLLLCSSGFLVKPNEQKWERVVIGSKTVNVSVQPVCRSYSGSVVNDDDRGFRYFICNPTTKQFKRVSFPSREFQKSLVTINLAFDPLKSPHYKVISLRRTDRESRESRKVKFQIDIFSSETDSWSLLGINFTSRNGLGINGPVFLNGAIHWTSEDVNSLYFDIDNKCLKTMPMPPLTHHGGYREVRHFGESRGHLHLVVTYEGSILEFDVLEMATDYSGWFVRYHVNLDAVGMAFPGLIWHSHDKYHPFAILGVIRAEKEEDSVVVIFVDGKAISYNIDDGTSKKLRDLEPSFKVAGAALDYEGDESYQYFETLSGV